MKFRTRVWMLPVSAALVFVGGVITSYIIGAGASSSLHRLRAIDNPFMMQAQGVEQLVDQFRLILQAAASEGDADRLKEVDAIAQKTRQALTELGAIPDKAREAQALAEAFDRYQGPAMTATKAMIDKADAGDSVKRMQAAQTTLQGLIKSTNAQAVQATLDREGEVDKGLAHVQLSNLATGLVVLLVLGVASGLIVRSVWRDLGEEPSTLHDLMAHVAAGNLQIQAHVSPGDNRSLNAALVQMVTKLRSMVGDIRSSTQSIASAAGEIAQGNQDLSVRTETTAANLQQTASSMDTLTSIVRQSADAANQANQLAAAAVASARQGGGVVAQVVTNMEEINAASSKITEIIGVIDGIAFQTNILALNAAVEAARAGDQGRGFAVVAGEVRTLAQRSAQAAREIKSLIVSSGEKVQNGTRLVHEAGTAMDDIVRGVARVTDVIAEISAAAGEQSAGIGTVNGAVAQLDQMTQQNAALVEQSAAAAASMRDTAQRLSGAVAAFRVDGSETGVTPAPHPHTVTPPAPALAAPSPAPARAASTSGSADWETF